ncbi:MAG: CHAT domain-containing protein [Candidatus Competibacteraceae bacterium]
MLENEDFRSLGVQRELRETPHSIVHIASHGQFASDVRNTFLLTFDDKLTWIDWNAFMALGQYRDQPVELLILSARQTAAGDDRAALGLAGVAVKAGGRSALATLWFINDQLRLFW